MKGSTSLLALGLLLAACGGSGGSSGGPGSDASGDAGVDFGTWDTGADATATDPGGAADPGGTDPGAPPDATGDDGGLQPLDVPTDLPKGDAGFGEPCSSGADCQTGLCFQTSEATGCTVPCTADADCLLPDAPILLICQWLGGDVRGCVPPLITTAVACTDSSVCPWPTLCRTDLGTCELDPTHCAWDGDCPEGKACTPLLRICRPAVCQGNPQCMDPRLVCREGQCVEPECATDASCGEGKYCQAGNCQVAQTCNDEDKCYYQDTCTNGFCMPNRCNTCTQQGKACDPVTGKCGTACTSSSQCPAGQTCLGGAACVVDSAPYAAARVRLAGQLVAAGDVSLGPAIPLDGSLSFDPDGDALTWRWVVNAAPFGSGHAPGTPLSTSVTAELTPDVAGLYTFGLWVTDAIGAVSFQDQVVVRVW